MPNRPLPTIAEESAELERRLRQTRRPEQKRRLHLLVLVQRREVATRREAAAHLAVHRNTVARWLGRYEEGGLAGLLEEKKRGPRLGQRTLPGSVFEALKARLEDPQGFASFKAIQTWLLEEYDLAVPYKSVYNLVRYRLGAKLKRPRPEHPKKA